MCYYEDFSLDILKKLLLLCLDFLEVLPVGNTVRRESVRTCFQFQPVRLILQFMVRSFLFFFFWGGGGTFDVIRRGGALGPFEELDFYVCFLFLFLYRLELV